MITYSTYTNSNGDTVIQGVREDGSNIFIPTDPANSDYQAYLATLAANSAPQG